MAKKIEQLLSTFLKTVSQNEDIYNEFSLQHELGIFLKKELPNHKVQFERNIKFFYPNCKTTKHEIDIVIYSKDLKEKYAIELKNPRNGQHPEQMYQFIKDIAFMEEAKDLGFTNTFCITLVNDHLFYKRDNASQGIYEYFRSTKTIHGTIVKPTGKKNSSVCVKGSYSINWNSLNGTDKYYILTI